jgi:hypothetical protein
MHLLRPSVAELDARSFHSVRPQLSPYDESGNSSSRGNARLSTGGVVPHRHFARRTGRARRSSRDQESRGAVRGEQAYGARIPQTRPGQRQSLYDWAPLPASEDNEEHSTTELPFTSHDFSAIMLEARELGLNFPEGEAQALASPRHVDPFGGGGVEAATSAAALRNSTPRRIARARSHHWPDETSSSLARDRGDGFAPDSSRSQWDGGGQEDVFVRSRFYRLRNDVLMRLGESSAGDLLSPSTLPAASKEVERAIDYLSTVRMCRTPEESLRLAVRAGFNNGDDWLELFDQQPKCDDFVLNTLFLKVAETSWLKAGGVFLGSQVAPTISSPSARSSPGGRTSSSSSSTGVVSSQWSVKVSISSIEYSQLRLSKCFTGWPNVCSSMF